MLVKKNDSGFSLIELVVVLVVIAILAALILPAVQMAREAGRNMQCKNNLKQIMLAAASYESVHRVFPPGSSYHGSLHLSILPYMEQESLYHQLVEQIEISRAPSSPVLNYLVPPIETFLCPSDPAEPMLSEYISGTNYAGDIGVWLYFNGYDGVFRSINDRLYEGGPVQASDISDGLSNTIALGEILRGNGAFNRLRTNWNTPRQFDNANELDAFADYCDALPPHPPRYGWRGDPWAKGTPWSNGSVNYTLFNHVLTPNKPSCYNRTYVPASAATSASMHPGGVNVVFADGHVDFINETIGRTAWRSLGSRNEQ